jgi:quercetin dioxygenase-like cupin family protein
MVNSTDFEKYKSVRLSEGFDEVVERVWPAGAVAGAHTHPFSVKAEVVQGELWLTVGDETRHLFSGDSFELERNVLHSERYGDSGATFWVARKHD